MKCKKCGYEIDDNQKFCIRCGEPVSADNTVHKKSKKKIIIPIVAVCAVLLIVIIVAVSNSGNKNENSFDSNNQNYNDIKQLQQKFQPKIVLKFKKILIR